MSTKAGGASSKKKQDYQLVSRLVQYAFRVFNLDMNGFFMKYCNVFDQTPAEMKKNGETLEQYDVFRKYEEQLDKHMDSFVTKEGFNSVEECFVAIERAVKTDKRDHAERMEELTSQLKSLEEEAAAHRQEKALEDAAETGEEVDDLDTLLSATDLSIEDKKKKKVNTPSAAAMSSHAPAMLYLQPLTLEQMVESVLNMADYQTFSGMMRIRAAQMRKLRDAEAIAKKRHEDIRARAVLLSSSETAGEKFVELFDSLRNRICELTPKRSDLKALADKSMDSTIMQRFLADESLDAYAISLKKLVTFIFDRIAMLCSPNHVATVKQHKEHLKTNVRKMDYRQFTVQLLEFGHADVDRIEKEIQAFFLWQNRVGL
jgi:hypothetical protein